LTVVFKILLSVRKNIKDINMNIREIVTIAGLVLLSATAVAGRVQPVPVQIDLFGDGSGRVIGNMTTARYSENDVEFIGCGTRNSGDGFQFAFCQASDAEANAVFCSTENPELVAAVRAIADQSFIIFRFDAVGECTFMGFSTQSYYLPRGDQEDKN
jgi:hypothetical protein